jgi:hypothetical protein
MDRNEIPYDPCHLGVPIGASKTIFEPMVRSVQTAHLSCTDSNSVSKRTEMRFHMTHVTYEFHSVHPKQFLSLWCIRCKLRTYLALWLALSLSPNGPKRASTLASSSRSTVGCIQRISEPLVVWRKPCNYLAPILTLSANGLKLDSTWPMSPRSSIGCVQNDFWIYCMVGAIHAPIYRQE